MLLRFSLGKNNKTLRKLYGIPSKLYAVPSSLRTSLRNFTPMDFYFPSAFLCSKFALLINEMGVFRVLRDLRVLGVLRVIGVLRAFRVLRVFRAPLTPQNLKPQKPQK